MTLRYLPNVITCLRILLVIPIIIAIFHDNYQLACYLFIVAGISDALDGFIARQFNCVSRFGSIADPVADKILLTSCFIVLAINGAIACWLPILIILRDLWVIAGAVSYHYLISHYKMAPSLYSKISTFLQILLLFLTLVNRGITALNPSVLQIIAGLTAIACVLSAIHYTSVWGNKAWKVYSKRKPDDN